MRVLWTGTFEPGFERNRRLSEYLEAGEIDYDVLRVGLWPEDRVAAFERARLRVAIRMMIVYPVLFARLVLAPAPDLYLVSYPGWFDIPVVWLAARLKRRPLVFDIFISLYDTAVSDRGLARDSSLVARVLRLFDRLSMSLSDRIIADCPSHARFLASLANVDDERFGVVYLGADETVFEPTSEPNTEEEGTVLFYGTYVPLQGVEWIVRSATYVSSEVRFRLVGRGQARARAEHLASELGAHNIEFVDFMPQPELVEQMRAAALCLGIFGTSHKADRVVPHKVYEALACARPVLTAATEAVTEVLTPSEVAVCPPGDPQALGRAITELLEDEDRRSALARAGRARFEKDFSCSAQSARLRRELDEVAVAGGRPI